MSCDLATLMDMAGRFLPRTDLVRVEPYGTGHINETFAVTCVQAGQPVRYLLQRLNTGIFTAPCELMGNIASVTGHIRSKLQAQGLPWTRRVLTLLPERDTGRPYMQDPGLGFWRCYLLIEGARTYDVIDHPDQAYQAARAFGEFQSLLEDYDGPRLFETIPRFHHTPSRLAALQAAVEADWMDRARHCRAEIGFALARAGLAQSLARRQADGAIPVRITHNDTKLNNVLLDDSTGEGVCVIDLDTVMPGLSLHDFGDMVRTACNPGPEDGTGIAGLEARVDMFEALARGYLEGTGGALLPLERELLATSGQVLTYESGLRFLTDHLQGDTYFRTHHEGHNLERARNQFALLASLEQLHAACMDSILDLLR